MNVREYPFSKIYIVLLGLFLTILFANNVTVYKVVSFGSLKLSAASLIYPITYWILDIVTEIYGYDRAKFLIWFSTILNIIFAMLISLLIHLPSLHGWTHQAAFDLVFSNIFFICIMHGIAAPASYLINAKLLSKLKILTRGRFFCIRSVTTSLIG